MTTTTAVKERPILFSGPMVRAILEGRKTQTRRVIKPQPECIDHDVWQFGGQVFAGDAEMSEHLFHEVYGTKGTPYGSLWAGGGDRLWVRETWGVISFPDNEAFNAAPSAIAYRADGIDDCVEKWKPSIHMPRLFSRITLEITDVRVQRLQDISDDDIRAEGVEPDRATDHPRGVWYTAFMNLWQSINGPDSWYANPWVWCITFRKADPA